MTLADLTPEETALVLTFRRIRREQTTADDARLGFAIAAEAERRMVAPVVAQFEVSMVDDDGLVHDPVLAATEQAAADIAAAWRSHGRQTMTVAVTAGGGR